MKTITRIMLLRKAWVYTDRICLLTLKLVLTLILTLFSVKLCLRSIAGYNNDNNSYDYYYNVTKY